MAVTNWMSPRFDTGTSGDPGEDFRFAPLPEDIADLRCISHGRSATPSSGCILLS